MAATSLVEDTSYPPDDVDPVLHLPDELVWKILQRLPVKSLMRFKCVSKLWQSIILDPSFARAYRGGFRGVLINTPFSGRVSPAKGFFYLNLFDDIEGDDIVNDDANGPDWNNVWDEIIKNDFTGPNCKSGLTKSLYHNHTVDHGNGRKLGSTDIVNGLVCFYSGNYSCLYNIATREIMELPLSQYDNKFCSYHLGFDPVNKLYKLLKICPIYDEEEEYFNEENLADATLIRNLDCEILTLGMDKSWRNIDAAPEQIVSRSVCFDGVVYWSAPTTYNDDDDADADEHLIAFHLAREKFEFVSTPPDCRYRLSRFAPGLALMDACFPRRVDIIRYDNGGWLCDEQKLKLPRQCYVDPDARFDAVGILPDGRVLILDHDTVAKKYYPFACYLYEPIEKMFTRILIRHQSPSSPYIMLSTYIVGSMYYFEENIIPLSCV